jgi:hypothetical protein
MNTHNQEPIDSNITSGENLSYWLASSKPIIFEKFEKSVQTDVLVIGGGISGLTTAYCLAKAGRKVMLVEDGFIGSGESGRTTGHITHALDDFYYELEKIFGTGAKFTFPENFRTGKLFGFLPPPFSTVAFCTAIVPIA